MLMPIFPLIFAFQFASQNAGFAYVLHLQNNFSIW